MTATPQFRIVCDRCLDSTTMPILNTSPPQRTDGPEGWATFRIGSDLSQPPHHLCPPCAFGLDAYFKGAALGTKEDT